VNIPIRNAGTNVSVRTDLGLTTIDSSYGDANHGDGRSISPRKQTEPSLEDDIANKLEVRLAQGRFTRTPKQGFILSDIQSVNFRYGYEGHSFIDGPGKMLAIGGDLRDRNVYDGGAPSFGMRFLGQVIPSRQSIYATKLSNPGRDSIAPPRVFTPALPNIRPLSTARSSQITINRGK
jgi:hypothetical protein